MEVSASTAASSQVGVLVVEQQNTANAGKQNAREAEAVKAGQSKEQVNINIEKVVEAVNKALQAYRNTELKLQVHEATNIVIIRILDSETDEVIREIPPEKMLDLVAKLEELVGIIVDETR